MAKQRIRVIKPAPRKREESSLLADIRLALGSRPDFLLTRINTGVFSAPGKPTTRIRSAPNGFPDLIGTQLRRMKVNRVTEGGFMRHEADAWVEYGQAIAIETKSSRGVLSEDQENWRRAFEAVGGIYKLCRNLADAESLLGQPEEWTILYQRALEAARKERG